MCFDGRAKSAEPLMRAVRKAREMGLFDEPVDPADTADLARLVPEVEYVSRDTMAAIIMEMYATDNDGFATVKARLEAARTEEARRRDPGAAYEREAEAWREAEEWWAAREKAKPWERLALLVMLAVVVWGIYVGWPR